MRIALVSPTPVPPTYGGQDRLLEGLHAALDARHPTDLLTIPVDERTREGCLRGYHDFHHLDLSAYDRVVTYKAPAYMVRHPNQVLYLSHRMRVFYDLWQDGDAEHRRMRDLIRFLDDQALDARRLPFIFTVGETVTRRLRQFGNIASVPVHHPTTFHALPPAPGEYFLSVGRLHAWKRVDLIVRALRLSKADCPLKIVGVGPDEARLRELAGGDPRVEFLGAVDDAELARLYSRAIATIFPPIREDMGLITFESFMSGKIVLTTTDSGEPSLIVREGETGYLCEPTPEAMAHSLDQLWIHRREADAMGANCLEWMKQVTWDRLVGRLLDAGDEIHRMRHVPPAAAPASGVVSSGAGLHVPAIARGEVHRDDGKIRLLVTDNQILDPPVGGGRIRILELYRHLPDDFETTYVGMFDWPGPVFRDQWMAPNLREVVTPMTAVHFKVHNRLARWSGGRAGVDTTMSRLAPLTPRWRRLIERHLPGKHALISAHPWLFPHLPPPGEGPGTRPRDLPVVYDSQNCEDALKGPHLRGTFVGGMLARDVERVERRAVLESDLVLACSEADAEAFVARYGVEREKIALAPNGVDCDAIRPADEAERRAARERLGIPLDAPHVVFTGSNYEPNLEGLLLILESLAPEFPAARFSVVGGVGIMFRERFPGRDVPPNVDLLGFVEKEAMLDAYRSADVALNPMRQGSGTNIKMLDYMAAGIAILTTPVGARGLEGRSGEQWIEANPGDFANELRALLGAEGSGVTKEAATARRRELGARGRRHAEERFDWKSISATYAERLRALVRAGRPA